MKRFLAGLATLTALGEQLYGQGAPAALPA